MNSLYLGIRIQIFYDFKRVLNMSLESWKTYDVVAYIGTALASVTGSGCSCPICNCFVSKLQFAEFFISAIVNSSVNCFIVFFVIKLMNLSEN